MATWQSWVGMALNVTWNEALWSLDMCLERSWWNGSEKYANNMYELECVDYK